MGVGVRLLLDTHAFLWWLAGDPTLPPAMRELIANEGNIVYVSAASAWEIATKFRLGKLPGAAAVAADVEGCVRSEAFLPLPVSLRHAQQAGALPGPHRDPFDRMLIAQALTEGCIVVSNDRAFDGYGVVRSW